MAATSDAPFNIMGAAASQFSNRGANENKRATIFFNLRENSAGGLEQLLESKNSAMSVIVESTEGANNSIPPSSARKYQLQQTP